MEKLYFENTDSTFCSRLEEYLYDAKEDGLKEITLVEAIPDNNNPDFIWCIDAGECVERHMCKKSQCEGYTSKSGRGVCSNRGNLYQHGEEVKFNIK